jgi:hypothetical protein
MLGSHLQVLASLNVRFEFGKGTRPRAKPKDQKDLISECLITVFALKNIEAGAELLASYGPNYWTARKA